MKAGAPTHRDGPFASDPDFPSSGSYATEKYPIDPPKLNSTKSLYEKHEDIDAGSCDHFVRLAVMHFS
jgi:hypothetical protein